MFISINACVRLYVNEKLASIGQETKYYADILWRMQHTRPAACCCASYCCTRCCCIRVDLVWLIEILFVVPQVIARTNCETPSLLGP